MRPGKANSNSSETLIAAAARGELDESLARQLYTLGPEVVTLALLAAGKRRIRPCLMTTATILALLPVLTSKGRGADIMVPMAIPSFGGMTIEIITMLVVPVLFCTYQEIKFKAGAKDAQTVARELECPVLRQPSRHTFTDM